MEHQELEVALRVRADFTVSAVLAALLGVALPAAQAEERPGGIVAPVVLPQFDRTAPACAPPPGLARSLVFLRDNQRDFVSGIDAGLAAAAREIGRAHV